MDGSAPRDLITLSTNQSVFSVGNMLVSCVTCQREPNEYTVRKKTQLWAKHVTKSIKFISHSSVKVVIVEGQGRRSEASISHYRHYRKGMAYCRPTAHAYCCLFTFCVSRLVAYAQMFEDKYKVIKITRTALGLVRLCRLGQG